MTRSKAFLVPVLLLVAVAFGATASPALSGSKSEKALPTLNRRIVSAINHFRLQHGLSALRVSTDLNASALQHSDEMGAVGYFNHPSADGTAFWKRIQSYYTSTNYSYWSVGENLLWAAPNIRALPALKMWIASPEHLANLLDKEWTNIGVSAVHVPHAGGVYGNSPVTIVTTDFGVRH